MQSYRIVPVHRSARRSHRLLSVRTADGVRKPPAALALDRPQAADDGHVLDVVRAGLLEAREVRLIDAAGDVLAREDGAVECRDVRVEAPHGLDEVRQRLEDDEVGADGLRDLGGAAPVRDELHARGHVDAVHVREPGGGMSGGRAKRTGAAYRIGGAQLATMTFFAPTSLAIWIISLEVVPRTMESEVGSE